MKAYHYTTQSALSEISETKALRNVTDPFPKFYPQELPGAVYAFLKEQPEEWTKNKEFKHTWKRAVLHLCKSPDIALLSFDVASTDNAYVMDWAHVERFWKKGRQPITRELINSIRGKKIAKDAKEAFKMYWDSRIPIQDYNNEHDLPEVAIFNPIEHERLKVEWIRPWEEHFKGTISLFDVVAYRDGDIIFTD